MPQVKFAIGPVDLGKFAKDSVLAYLYNGYRVDNDIRPVPGKEAFATVGAGKVFHYYSLVHDKLVAVCAGKIYNVTKTGVVTEITGATLTADVRPTFTEDKDSIFIAAASEINRWQVSGTTIALPRRDITPVLSNRVAFTETGTSLHFTTPLSGRVYRV